MSTQILLKISAVLISGSEQLWAKAWIIRMWCYVYFQALSGLIVIHFLSEIRRPTVYLGSVPRSSNLCSLSSHIYIWQNFLKSFPENIGIGFILYCFWRFSVQVNKCDKENIQILFSSAFLQFIWPSFCFM